MMYKRAVGRRFLHSTLSPYEHEVLRHTGRLSTASGAPRLCCVTASFPLGGHFRGIFLPLVCSPEKRRGHLTLIPNRGAFSLLAAGYYQFNGKNRPFVLKIQHKEQLFCQGSTKDSAKNLLFSLLSERLNSTLFIAKF